MAFDTIELNRQIRSDGCSVTTFVPFHGTPLRTMSETLGYVPPGQVAQSIFNPTMLKMPHWGSEQIAGLIRCFVLYVSLPKTMWPEVKKAEELTPKGDEIWNNLRQYALDNEFVWKDPTITVDDDFPDVGPTSDGNAVPLKESLLCNF